MNLHDEIWLRAVAETGEDAVSSAAGVSVSEAERILSEAGFDTKQERARALEIIAKLKGAGVPATDEIAAARDGIAPAKDEIDAAKLPGAAASGAARRANGATTPASEAGDAAIEAAAWVSGPSAPARVPRASRNLVWLAAALAAAATTGGILYAVGHRSKPPEKPFEPPREAPSAPTASATASANPPASPQPMAPASPAESTSPKGKVPGYSNSGKPLPKGQ
jgi:hypothetical protein